MWSFSESCCKEKVERHWRDTSQELCLSVFLSIYHDELHIISFISFRLQPLCSADMNKKPSSFSLVTILFIGATCQIIVVFHCFAL